MNEDETYISVDVETSGPIPGEYDLLSIGACLVEEPDTSFYVEIKPFAPRCDDEALSISGLSIERLLAYGQEPARAMAQFATWIGDRVGASRPVFVGFNAPFDWSFVNWYFHYFTGNNPFGFTALDIKSFYMGLAGCKWGETSSGKLPEEFKPVTHQKHNSLSDAQAQAGVFCRMLHQKRA